MRKYSTRYLLAGALACCLLCTAISIAKNVTERSVKSLLKQKSNGIAIQIEKVTIDRVFNVDGYKQINGKDQQDGSYRVARVFMSFTGAIANVKTTQFDIKFANSATGKEEGVSAFSDPMWAKRNPHIKVDSKATGYEYWIHLDKDQPTSTLFPASLIVTLTMNNGEIEKFTFDKISI